MGKNVKKLSAKAVLGAAPSMGLFEEGETAKILFTALGRTNAVKKGESNYGDWTCFLGEHIFINASTGEEFVGSKAFLPEVAQTPLELALAENDGAVEYAFNVGIRKSESSPIGWEYYSEALGEQSASSPLERMKQQFLDKIPGMKALPPAAEKHDEKQEKKKGKK